MQSMSKTKSAIWLHVKLPAVFRKWCPEPELLIILFMTHCDYLYKNPLLVLEISITMNHRAPNGSRRQKHARF